MSARRPRALSWEGASVMVAVLSLVAASLFNAFQVRQAREATELQVLSDTSSHLREEFARLESHTGEELAVRAGKDHYSERTMRDIDSAFTYFEYFAWLANHHSDVSDGARLWGRQIECDYEDFLLPVFHTPRQRAALRAQLPNLTAFIQRYRPCPR